MQRRSGASALSGEGAAAVSASGAAATAKASSAAATTTRWGEQRGMTLAADVNGGRGATLTADDPRATMRPWIVDRPCTHTHRTSFNQRVERTVTGVHAEWHRLRSHPISYSSCLVTSPWTSLDSAATSYERRRSQSRQQEAEVILCVRYAGVEDAGAPCDKNGTACVRRVSMALLLLGPRSSRDLGLIQGCQ